MIVLSQVSTQLVRHIWPSVEVFFQKVIDVEGASADITLAQIKEGMLVGRFSLLTYVNSGFLVGALAVLYKNATLTGPSWATSVSSNVDYDETATAMTGGTIVAQDYVTSTSQGRSAARVDAGYNWDLQLGSSIAGVSDIYTLAIRTLDATPTGETWGALSFFYLTTQ